MSNHKQPLTHLNSTSLLSRIMKTKMSKDDALQAAAILEKRFPTPKRKVA